MRWPWKLGHGHQNHILLHFATMIQYIKFSKNALFNSRDILQKPYFGQNLTFQSADVSLKIRSGSPKSNQLLTLS